MTSISEPQLVHLHKRMEAYFAVVGEYWATWSDVFYFGWLGASPPLASISLALREESDCWDVDQPLETSQGLEVGFPCTDRPLPSTQIPASSQPQEANPGYIRSTNWERAN